MAGAAAFKYTLSWPRFRKLPIGHDVFWRTKGSTRGYHGRIEGFKEYSETEFMVVRVIKAPRHAETGLLREISQRYFEDCRFTAEQPAPVSRGASFEAANRALQGLLGSLNSQWIWADGAEGILVTSITSFERSISELSLSVDSQLPISMSDLLCLGRNSGHNHSKMRVDHPKGEVSGEFPLAILDGSAAFSVHEHMANVSNVLVILDRQEYQENIHGQVLQLRIIANHNCNDNIQNTVPKSFPPGIELASYLIDR